MSTVFRWSDVIADRKRLDQEMAARRVISFSDVGYTLAPTGAVYVVELGEAEEDMVSLRKDVTGFDNTVFVSTRGNARHAARIKIAVDPWDSLDPSCKSASMAIHDYSVRGEYLPRNIAELASQFIERNRAVLLEYWDFKLDTSEMVKRLKAP
jgi:hypothetical protein